MDQTITNDLTITVATVNGSGSQSSNLILARSLLAMGIPVGPKNLFPSNIQGLPTWFTVRANAQGYVAQKDEVDLLVALNLATWDDDVRRVHAGGVIIHEASFPQRSLASAADTIVYAVPFEQLAKEKITNEKLRKLLTNLIYVGVLAELLGIEELAVKDQIGSFFKSKPKAVQSNIEAFEIGVQYAREHLVKRDPFRVSRIDIARNKIMIDGNEAAAIGAVFGGCTVLSWYPITPSSTLCENMIEHFAALRVDPQTGKRNYAVVQAEDELAAIGMVIGAGWAGARSMTATSGPGISLMAEFAGLAYYTETPAVVWNIQRGGPSTGLPTRTAQGDIQCCARLSHGDTRHVCLIPANPAECFEFAQVAMDLAERLQTMVFVLSDLDLGMNLWMSDPFEYSDRPYDRGKVLDAEQLAALEDWGRYKDLDGDGIPYRTLPGIRHPRGAFLTRGSGHDEYGRYSENANVYRNNLDRLARKYQSARDLVPAPEICQGDYGPASIGLIAYGTSDCPMREVRDILAQNGIPTDYLRLRAIPFCERVVDFIREHDRVFLVEQNRDAQMRGILLEEHPEVASKIVSILHYDGMAIDARFIIDGVLNTVVRKESVVHG
jgi:2-oxoglutarate ferredoxin oxidoreductase subunit alpha